MSRTPCQIRKSAAARLVPVKHWRFRRRRALGSTKEVRASYSIPVGAHLSVQEGEEVTGGTLLAKTPRKVARTKDITGGLPRVAELFEARKPKDACVIAKIEGSAVRR